MKKRILTLMMLLLTAIFTTEANPVDMRIVREVAVKFMNVNAKTPLRGTQDLQLATTYHTANNDAAFYVFNAPKGYVIVSADDCAMPILGYSNEGQFDPNNLPEAIQAYLTGFVNQIQYGMDRHMRADEQTVRLWELVRSKGTLDFDRSNRSVSPLLTSRWGQGIPDYNYNIMCPEDPNGPNGHAKTGCTATAMAQIMRYWGYPLQGVGSHTYTPAGYPEQTANFGATTYDWENMPDSLDYSSASAQNNAVATLMWHCGVALEAAYGPYTTSAYENDVPSALINYFGYSSDAELAFQDDYADVQWLSMIKENLNQGRPIHYRGANDENEEGHMFVLDGYDANDLIHINWGWYGDCNGYFAMGAFAPGEAGYIDYSYYNCAVFNIHPECPLGTIYQVTTTPIPSYGGMASGAGSYECGSNCTLTATPYEGYLFNKWTKNGEVVSYLSTCTVPVTESDHYVAHFVQVDGIAIGEATSSNAYLPSYNYYSLTQQIYTADEIGSGVEEISSVSFFNTGYDYRTRNMNIYMVNTEKATFESTTDWIPVSDTDLVFSGNVSMTSCDWVTVYFSTPFYYDGSSNVALIVDDNSNSNNTSTRCRTFSTDAAQTLCVFGFTDFDPYDPSDYPGTLMLEKNQIVLRIPSYDYTVAVSANPSNGGAVSGEGGPYYYGQHTTISATANEGYAFNKWTKNGTVVSYFSTVHVGVTETAEYVANFEEVDGIAIGDAINTDSYLPIYNYNSLTEQIYTADEMGGEAVDISFVSFFNTGYSRSRNLSVYMVHTDKTAFESGSEWIAVSENDLVFSGSVTLSAYGWADIYFDRFFAFDGVSNVALVVYDHSNSYNIYKNFRTFDTEEKQAICIHGGNNTNYDPTDPYGYTGMLMSVKNQIVFGTPVPEYTVTGIANPTNGGTISGGQGLYYHGQSCALTATANPGYVFYCWKENGTIKSYNLTYTFRVTGNMQLEACFIVPYTINVSANPSEGGTVSGGGEYGYNQSCTLTATANEGYMFLSWTKNGGVVSCLPTYTFLVKSQAQYVAHFVQVDGIVIGEPIDTSNCLPSNPSKPYSLTQQIYTAEELDIGACEISSISFVCNGYNDPRDVTIYMVNTSKTSFDSSTDWIAVTEADKVFSGSFTVSYYGMTTVYFNTVFNYDGYSNVALIVDDNTNSWDNRGFRTFDTETMQAISICGDGINYDPLNPGCYSGTLMSMKNQVVLGLPTYEYTMTLSADPEEGGMVSGGGGLYFYGQPVPVIATANPGYAFYYWTKYHEGYEYNEVVSYLSTDNLPVTEDVEYVAHFQHMPGIIIGEANHTNEYLPANTEGSCAMSQQIYTADELNIGPCDISSVSFFSTEYCDEPRNLAVYMVNTNKTKFNSEYDWVVVTEADQVFSGEVTMYGAGWITIDFFTPFAYDGTSNVVLVVNDLTDEWGWGWSCRTFDTQDTQAMYVIGDEGLDFGKFYSINPYYPFVYSGTLMSEKNQVVFGIANYQYTVTVSANPAEGGTVSGGGGIYSYGQPVMLNATANEGYVFNNWTRYGMEVSCASTFILSVFDSGEYVANFEQCDGILVGDASTTSSYLPSYSVYDYSLTQQIYTAEEIGADCNITSIAFYNGGWRDGIRNFDVYLVHTDKTVFNSERDWIPVSEADKVFTGNVVMAANAWTAFTLDTPFAYDGVSNLALIVDDNTGDMLGSMDCRVYDAVGNQAICVYSNGLNYDTSASSNYYGTLMTEKNQIILGVTQIAEEQCAFTAGTNWFSTNLEITIEDLQAALRAALPSAANRTIKIKSQDAGECTNVGTIWVGQLSSLDVTQMYMISVPTACGITLEGMPIDPAEHPVTIKNGANWIGFPLFEEMTLTDAFAGFAVTNDVVKSQNDGQATKRGGNLWGGTLKKLEPGQGYIYNSVATGERTLVFPTGAK